MFTTKLREEIRVSDAYLAPSTGWPSDAECVRKDWANWRLPGAFSGKIPDGWTLLVLEPVGKKEAQAEKVWAFKSWQPVRLEYTAQGNRIARFVVSYHKVW